jgi:hypothetical protein
MKRFRSIHIEYSWARNDERAEEFVSLNPREKANKLKKGERQEGLTQNQTNRHGVK